MILLWTLIIANLIGGFLAASGMVVSKIPELGKTAKALEKFKSPIGLGVLIISVLNIFNFWAPHYPKLTLLVGLLLGAILSVEYLGKLNVSDDDKEKWVNIAQKISIPVGITAIIISLIWILELFLKVLEIIL